MGNLDSRMGRQGRWPSTLAVQLRVDQTDDSPTVRHRLRLAPAPSDGGVLLFDRSSSAGTGLRVIDWRHLPGVTMLERTAAVVSVALFGDTGIPPRDGDAPCWRSVELRLVDLAERPMGMVAIQLQVAAPTIAIVRYRSESAGLLTGFVRLYDYDTDGLRAVLRRTMCLGMLHLSPADSDAAATVRSPVTSELPQLLQ